MIPRLLSVFSRTVSLSPSPPPLLPLLLPILLPYQLQDDFHVPIFDEDMDDGGLDVYAMQAYYDEMWAESVESFSKSLPGDLDVLSGEASVQDADRWVWFVCRFVEVYFVYCGVTVYTISGHVCTGKGVLMLTLVPPHPLHMHTSPSSVVTRAATVPSVITTSSCEATHLIPRPASVSDLDADSRDKGMCSPTPGVSVPPPQVGNCALRSLGVGQRSSSMYSAIVIEPSVMNERKG